MLKDQLIQDRIVVELRNKKLSEKLQLDANLSLEKATAQAMQSEEIKKQQSVIHGQEPTVNNKHNIDTISKNSRPRSRENTAKQTKKRGGRLHGPG